MIILILQGGSGIILCPIRTMNIATGFLVIQGAPITGTNPLPVFRDRQQTLSPRSNGTLSEDELKYFGFETGFRVLPYRMQDRYTRQKQTLKLPTVILENNHLRAEFLPGYGGRLYSLYNKDDKKELLYRNPVIQPANLAIRNAWFSGGIEWNIAQLGHTFTTCDDVFFSAVSTEDGYEFLRMYDYERTKGLLWQIDFHLPEDSKQLYAHVSILNTHPLPVPMYWWTNIAVREEPGCRIFSETKEVIYIEPDSLKGYSAHAYGHSRLPYLPVLSGADASYPLHFDYANEYFFQNSKNMASPWEAITYQDGNCFYERSTQPLSTRKMFCWGKHSGGRHWLDYLSVPGNGNYVEIQAGLTPTQLHGMEMPADGTICFTQAFGGTTIEPGSGNHDSYDISSDIVRTAVNTALPDSRILSMDQHFKTLSSLPCTKLLHTGHGWGALENIRRQKEDKSLLPEQFYFPAESLTQEQADWLALMQGQTLKELTIEDLPVSWMTDPDFIPYLLASLQTNPGNTAAMAHLGTILYESGHFKQAIELWNQAVRLNPLPIFWRNLAYAAHQDKDLPKAISFMEHITFEEYMMSDHAFLEEYFSLLLEDSQWAKVYSLYQKLPDKLQTLERLLIPVCQSALELNEYHFLESAFQYDFAQIREGETTLTTIWFEYARRKGISFDQLPANLDMRVVP